ncbi:peptidyl-prolyl cis-trans isomerase [Desulfonatronum thioautotrophicum]|uniref:peptidylprolyl isomerase n=1 Tax=Desulfonatronum thioautotrophicum TaxID=617001 RepID=UPI0005EB1E3C|nr:peptidyl-prolyl cis-trans isomerase [Desulfonatronum thioautotrophicum]
MPIARKLVVKLLFIVFLSLLLAGCQVVEAPQWSEGGARAEGNGQQTRIDEDFLMAYARHLAQTREHGGQVTADSVLEFVQNMEALLAEARAQGMDQVSEFRQAVHQFKTDLLMRALQSELVPEISRESITDEDARAFFDENPQVYTRPELYALSVLSIHDPELAAQLQEAAERGELDMEDAAARHELALESHDPLPMDRLPAVWREVLAQMQPGEYSPLLATPDRQAILRLDQIVPERVQDFEERKEYIRNDVLYSRYRQAWQEAYARLRDEHNIRIDPEVAERFREMMEEGAEG